MKLSDPIGPNLENSVRPSIWPPVYWCRPGIENDDAILLPYIPAGYTKITDFYPTYQLHILPRISIYRYLANAGYRSRVSDSSPPLLHREAYPAFHFVATKARSYGDLAPLLLFLLLLATPPPSLLFPLPPPCGLLLRQGPISLQWNSPFRGQDDDAAAHRPCQNCQGARAQGRHNLSSRARDDARGEEGVRRGVGEFGRHQHRFLGRPTV